MVTWRSSFNSQFGGKSLYCLTCLFQSFDPFNPWKVHSNSDNDESHDLVYFHFSTLSRVPCATSYCHIHSSLGLDEFSIHVLAPLWGQGVLLMASFPEACWLFCSLRLGFRKFQWTCRLKWDERSLTVAIQAAAQFALGLKLYVVGHCVHCDWRLFVSSDLWQCWDSVPWQAELGQARWRTDGRDLLVRSADCRVENTNNARTWLPLLSMR